MHMHVVCTWQASQAGLSAAWMPCRGGVERCAGLKMPARDDADVLAVVLCLHAVHAVESKGLIEVCKQLLFALLRHFKQQGRHDLQADLGWL